MNTFQCTNCGFQLQRPTQPYSCPQCGRQAIGAVPAGRLYSAGARPGGWPAQPGVPPVQPGRSGLPSRACRRRECRKECRSSSNRPPSGHAQPGGWPPRSRSSPGRPQPAMPQQPGGWPAQQGMPQQQPPGVLADAAGHAAAARRLAACPRRSSRPHSRRPSGRPSPACRSDRRAGGRINLAVRPLRTAAIRRRRRRRRGRWQCRPRRRTASARSTTRPPPAERLAPAPAAPPTRPIVRPARRRPGGQAALRPPPRETAARGTLPAAANSPPPAAPSQAAEAGPRDRRCRARPPRKGKRRRRPAGPSLGHDAAPRGPAAAAAETNRCPEPARRPRAPAAPPRTIPLGLSPGARRPKMRPPPRAVPRRSIAAGRIFLHVPRPVVRLAKKPMIKPKILWEYVTGKHAPAPWSSARTTASLSTPRRLSALHRRGVRQAELAAGLRGRAAGLRRPGRRSAGQRLDQRLRGRDPQGRCRGPRAEPGTFFRSRQKFDSAAILVAGVLYAAAESGYVFAIQAEGERGDNLWNRSATGIRRLVRPSGPGHDRRRHPGRAPATRTCSSASPPTAARFGRRRCRARCSARQCWTATAISTRA